MTMPAKGVSETQVVDWDAVRHEWLENLNALVAQVKTWSEGAGWWTRVVSVPTQDTEMGRFDVPLLLMERNARQIALNPVSRFPTGADGAAEFYVVPAYDVVAGLYLDHGLWTVSYLSLEEEAAGIREPVARPLSEATINQVLDEMTRRDP